MSLEAWGDDGDYDDNLAERAMEAGWISPDDAEELRDLLKHVDWPADAHSRGTAALLLIDAMLNSPTPEAGSEEATQLAWARVKLNRHILA